MTRTCKICKKEKQYNLLKKHKNKHGKFTRIYIDGYGKRWKGKFCRSCYNNKTNIILKKDRIHKPKNRVIRFGELPLTWKCHTRQDHHQRILNKITDTLFKNGFTCQIENKQDKSGIIISDMRVIPRIRGLNFDYQTNQVCEHVDSSEYLEILTLLKKVCSRWFKTRIVEDVEYIEYLNSRYIKYEETLNGFNYNVRVGIGEHPKVAEIGYGGLSWMDTAKVDNRNCL